MTPLEKYSLMVRIYNSCKTHKQFSVAKKYKWLLYEGIIPLWCGDAYHDSLKKIEKQIWRKVTSIC
jgi:hypothetical protein